MKYFYLLLFITICNLHANAQASWNTKMAFILRDENNNALTLDSFKQSYKMLNVYGDTVANDQLMQYLRYDEKTNYFIVDIETIGSRFSFALIHNNEQMVIYLPFARKDFYYAVDFKFRPGKFLFDFEIEDQEKIYINSNVHYCIIEKINWKEQSKKWKKSTYANDETYNKIQK